MQGDSQLRRMRLPLRRLIPEDANREHSIQREVLQLSADAPTAAAGDQSELVVQRKLLQYRSRARLQGGVLGRVEMPPQTISFGPARLRQASRAINVVPIRRVMAPQLV